MTVAETAKIIKKIFYSYPSAFKNMDLDSVITIWHEELGHYDYDKTLELTSEHIRNSKFAPTLADICVFKDPEVTRPEVLEDF